MTKSTKSQQRGLAPSSFRTTGGVHELVARAMRGKCVRQRTKRKSVVLPLSAISSIPRERTYRTKEPSRFVHALPARPLEKDRRAWVEPVRRRDKAISVIDTSSVSLRLPPSAPVSATPTAFASQIGQFPTGGGLQNPSAKFHAHFCNSTFGESCQRQECAILF